MSALDHFNEQERQVIRYVGNVLVLDSIKLCSIVLMFTLSDLLHVFNGPSPLSLGLMIGSVVTLRLQFGGFHLPNFTTCLLFTLGYYFMLFVIGQVWIIPVPLDILLVLLSSLLIIGMGAVIPPERKQAPIHMGRLRQRGVIVLVALLAIYVFTAFPYMPYIVVGQLLIMLAAKGVNR